MAAFKDITGKTYGLWIVISRVGSTRWRCQCQCGNFHEIDRHNLNRIQRLGTSSNCGCIPRDCKRKTHGLSEAPIYRIWHAMISRCTNPSTASWQHYGARGITVCERWRSFSNFFADMGHRPKGHSLDRKDNNAGYSPENCRWVTIEIQTRNRRSTKSISFNGKTQCIEDWAVELGLPSRRIARRLRDGMSVERALSRDFHKVMPDHSRVP